MQYWVVSANVHKNRKTLNRWIIEICDNKSAYMNWRKGTSKGKIFSQIVPGDAVLIAYGPMTNHGADRCLVGYGRVKKNTAARDPRVDLEHSQFAQLERFRRLPPEPRKSRISFEGTPYDGAKGGSNQPCSVFELRREDPKHPGNSAICDWLDRRLRDR